jgi:hypothetical protein
MDALFFQRADHALDQAVLLRTVRRDELLSKTIASNHPGMRARIEDYAVI